MPSSKPSNDVLLERLEQIKGISRETIQRLDEGFKTVNGRITKNTQDIYALQLKDQYDREALQDARADAQRILKEAAEQAKVKLADEKPIIGSNKWLLTTLVSIILALIAAGVVTR